MEENIMRFTLDYDQYAALADGSRGMCSFKK